MNTQELNEMFKGLRVGNVIEYRCGQCLEKHGLIVLQKLSGGCFHFANISSGKIGMTLPAELLWSEDNQQLEMLDGHPPLPMQIETISLESERFESLVTVANILKGYRDAHRDQEVLDTEASIVGVMVLRH